MECIQIINQTSELSGQSVSQTVLRGSVKEELETDLD